MAKKRYEITITADVNDGDYITEVSPISEEDLKIIKPLIKAIKNFKPYETKSKGSTLTWKHHHNYPSGEIVRGDLGEKYPDDLYDFDEKVFNLFEEFVPHGEYGIHTIKSITVGPLQKKTRLL